MNWALTRENMGILYLYRARNGDEPSIDLAIEAFEEALEVFSPEDHSYNYEKASASLAVAIAVRESLSGDS